MHCHECQQFRRQSFRYHFTVKSLNTKSWHGCRCTRETYFDLKISFSIFKLKNGVDCAKYSLYMCHLNKKSNKYRTFKVVHMTHKKMAVEKWQRKTIEIQNCFEYFKLNIFLKSMLVRLKRHEHEHTTSCHGTCTAKRQSGTKAFKRLWVAANKPRKKAETILLFKLLNFSGAHFSESFALWKYEIMHYDNEWAQSNVIQ